jgi:hypothetical protein
MSYLLIASDTTHQWKGELRVQSEGFGPALSEVEGVVLSEVEAGAADALHPPAARFAEGDRPIPTKSGLRRRKAGCFAEGVLWTW